MKENLKKIMEKHDKFLGKQVTVYSCTMLLFIFLIPLQLKMNKTIDRVSELEEQIKVIEVQKNETSN